MSDPTSQRSRLHRTTLSIATVLACGAALIFLGHRYLREPTLEELKADLEKRLPNGSSEEQAEAWFASHDIQSFPVYASKMGSDYVEKRGLKGTIPDDRPDDPGHIYIEVYLSDGKVWSWLVERRPESL